MSINHKMNEWMTPLFAIALLCFAPALLTPAHAEDGKVIAGIACQKSLGVGSVGGGALRNDSTTGSLTAECPIVRDSIYGGINDAYVRLYNASSSTSACTLNARSIYGTYGYSQYKSASGSGYKTLSYTPISDVNGGHYYFWCAIAPSTNGAKSRLISYRMDEN
ncbi:hypothetical protein [Alkalimarinus coralli]|uniref:hypothetical protein n=1 Tax=Alkalimarinus coralli TaxID=2935863 RepID=UPI00202AC944|nr:hypothetical protein [Alkalimarinus coralli]